jgi:4-amino-4-deoxy-L-arabinose transferase-like glycosyltransferase
LDNVSPPNSRAQRLGTALAALALFLIPLGRFLYVALSRFDYPFDLEWSEGGMLLHAQRLLTGQPLYSAPSLDFISFMYPPAYYALLAAVFRVGGVGYAGARLCSIAATLGTGALIAWSARRAGNSFPLALAWGGLWFSCFSLSGFFFDLARVDPVLTFVLVAAVVVLLEDVARPRIATFLILIFLAALAILIKQNAVMYVAALAAGLILSSGWKRGMLFGAATAGIVGIVVIVMQVQSGGWFWFYTVSIPRHHGVEWSRIWSGPGPGGIGRIPIAWLILPGLGALARESRVWRVLALVLAAAFVADLGMIGHRWSFDNVHMPLHAIVVLAAAVTAPALFTALGSRREAIPVWLLIAVALQVWVTGFDVARQIPAPEARAESERQVQALAAMGQGGRILAPEFPFLLQQAGLQPCFHISAFADVVYASDHGLPVDLSGFLPAAQASVGYLRGEIRLPGLLAPAFNPSRAVPFGKDADGWPPLDGRHNRPKKLIPRRE